MIAPELVLEEHRPAPVDDASIRPVGNPEGGAGPFPVRRVLQFVVLAVPVAVLAVLSWTHRSMFYDGYIYLHVVQNILAGNGPVFNAGHRVEAFTSPLWTAILSVAALATPLSLTTIAVDLGIAATVTGTGLVVVSATRLVRRAHPDAFLLPLGALVFVALPPIWSLASLGLETGLELLWIGCCTALLVRWAGAPGRVMPRYGLVVLGLGTLVRPELGLDTVVFLAVVLFVDRAGLGRRRQAAMVGWAVALPVAYEIFRMGYYGMVVANTAVAKEASLPRVGRGIEYLLDFSTPYWLFVPLLLLFVGAMLPIAESFRARARFHRSFAVLIALPVAGILDGAYITVMGGDYVHARLLVAPLFAVLAPVAVVPVARKNLVALLVIPWAALCATTLRSADSSPWSTAPFVVVTGHGQMAAPPAWATGRQSAELLSGHGVYVQYDRAVGPVRIDAPPADSVQTPLVATSWIGAGPYAAGTHVQILDLLGLADPLTAHLQLVRRGVLSGHEKPLPTPWMEALLTADGTSTAQMGALQGGRTSEYTRLIPDVTGRALDVETAWARAALACPAIAGIEYGPDRPLTIGSFFSDMVHSLSDTTVRVPADPETAYHRLCGPGTPTGVRRVEG